MANRVLVGKVAVDSGQIIICDPCYLIDNFGEAEYRNVCDRKVRGRYGEFFASGLATGVVSQSGWGDGLYPVYARLDRDGSVEKLEILFNVWM